MAGNVGERRFRPWYLLVVLLAIGGVTWTLVPSAFARGVVLGFVAGPLVLVAVVSLLARRFRRKISDRLDPPPVPTARWDFDLRAQDLDGNSVDFMEFSGKVLVLNLWATWCAPCVAEMPSLQRLHDAVADLEVHLVCLTQEDPVKVKAFVEKKGIGVPVYTLDGDLPSAFKARAIPATFILDKKGSVALRHFGAAAWDHGDVMEFVRGLATAPEL